MRQTIRQFLCILALTLLLPVVASAQIDTSDLTVGTWMYENSSIEFKADGTGVFVNNSGKTFDMTWTQADDQICVEYQFYGKRKLNLTIAETDGVWTLNDEDGRAYSIGGSAAETADNSYTVAFGEEIDLGFARITFTRIQLMREMHASGDGSYTTAPDDSHYFALVGTITNTSTGSLEVGNIWSEIMLDQYVYAASAKADHNHQLTTSVTPMTTSTYYVFSTLPDALTTIAGSGEIKLAFNDGFIGKPSGFDEADFVFKFTFDDKAVAKAWLPPERELVYFSDCPALPMPASYTEVDEISRFDMSDYNQYTYKKLLIYDEKEDLFAVYREGLTRHGYAIKGNGESFQVYSGTKKIADVTSNSFGWIEIQIPKGLSTFSKRPKAGTVASVPEESHMPTVKLGATITPANVRMKLADTGITDKIYSCIRPGNGRYYYYEPDSGDHLFYLHGSFHNVGGKPLDIRHIYAEFIFDGKYHYKGSSVGAKANAADFINTVTAQSSCDFYVFASVPASVLSKYKTCTIKLGFTDDFSIIFVQNELPDFSHCDTVYELEVK